MLFERRFEERSKGLICGPAILSAQGTIAVPLALDRRQRIIARDAAPLLWKPFEKIHVVAVKAREGGEIVWMRPYATAAEAIAVYAGMIGVDLDRAPPTFRLPHAWPEGELVYYYFVVDTFNSTPGGGTWTVPNGVKTVDYLVAAGAGGGGSQAGGGGGGGGYLTGAAFAVIVGAALTVTVGAGGIGFTAVNGMGSPGTNGDNSVFSTVTATGGGAGNCIFGAGFAGGSGGGAGMDAVGGGTQAGGAASPAGQGNAGGVSGDRRGGGGGGSAGAGELGTAAAPVDGGIGTSNSITGAAVIYSAGGGSGTDSALGGAAGRGGNAVAGNGAGNGTNGAGAGGTGTANQAGGGGAGGNVNGNPGGPGVGGGVGGAGGTGRVVLSYTPVYSLVYNPRRYFQPLIVR